ncbi:MAG: hypothetical protein JXR77_01235 [Lentisphaeria bacterium]|nr:hypothetical protein [Lentisphaeria bacterium]
MERDLARLRRCGLDGVILALGSDALSDAVLRERVRRFLHLSSAAAPPLRVVLAFRPEHGRGAGRIESGELAAWLTDLRQTGAASLYCRGPRVVVVALPGVEIRGSRHPSFLAIQARGEGGEWSWGPPDNAARLRPRGAERQVLIYAGHRGDPGAVDRRGRPLWAIPREDGEALRAELRRAFAAGALTICISSWNDFAAGDFVEPNSLDGEAAMEVLAREIARLREGGIRAAALPSPGRHSRIRVPEATHTTARRREE